MDTRYYQESSLADMDSIILRFLINCCKYLSVLPNLYLMFVFCSPWVFWMQVWSKFWEATSVCLLQYFRTRDFSDILFFSACKDLKILQVPRIISFHRNDYSLSLF